MTKVKHKLVCKGLLAISSVSIAIAVGASGQSTEYSLSIYRSTPIIFWFFIGASSAIAIGSALITRSETMRYLSGSLVLLNILAVFILPLLRGMFFLATVDAYAHLGWVRDIIQGTLQMDLLIYPAYHILAASVSHITGMSPPRSMLLLLALIATLYISTIGLFARHFSKRQPGFTFTHGCLAGFISLPIVTVRIPLFEPIPTVLALLIIPVPLFIAVRSWNNPRIRWHGLLLVVSVSLIFWHPQHAISLAGFLLGVVVATRVRKSPPWARLRPMAILVVLMGAVTSIWLATKPPSIILFSIISRFWSNLFGSTSSMSQLSNEGGDSVGQLEALKEIGGSLPELALKLMMPRIALVLFAIALLVFLFRTNRVGLRQQTFILGLLLGSIPLMGLVTIHLFPFSPSQIFRYLAVELVGAGILSAISVGLLTDVGNRQVEILLSALLLVSGVLMVPLMYPSPYIYQESGEVSKSTIAGYRLMFDHQSDIDTLSLRGPVRRQRAAIYGKSRASQGMGIRPSAAVLASAPKGLFPFGFYNHTLHSMISEPYYIPVSKRDRETSVRLYQSLYYSRGDFRYLRRKSNRIIDTGGVRIYLIRPKDPS